MGLILLIIIAFLIGVYVGLTLNEYLEEDDDFI